MSSNLPPSAPSAPGPLDPSGSPSLDVAVGRSSDDEFLALRLRAEEGLEQGAHAVESGRVETLRILLRTPEADGGDMVRIRVREQDDLVHEALRPADDLRDGLITDGVDQILRSSGPRRQVDDVAVHGGPLLSKGRNGATRERRDDGRAGP